jgi:hypothetical protein
MTVKDKLATAKTKIKKHAPEIVGFSIVVVTAATTLALKHLHDSQNTDLRVTDEDLELVKTEDVNMTYSINGSDYALRYVGNTPKN